MAHTTTYKLLRVKNGKLYPLYVNANEPLPIGEWVPAKHGEFAKDGKHVKSRIGPLSFRPGFHSTQIPFCDWIGKRGKDGRLYQSPDTVWCECLVDGNEIHEIGRNGIQSLPDGWYRFKTNQKQVDPWIISGRIKIVRILSGQEVNKLCESAGLTAQPMWMAAESNKK